MVRGRICAERALRPLWWWFPLRRLVIPTGLPCLLIDLCKHRLKVFVQFSIFLSVCHLPASACIPLKGRGLQRGELAINTQSFIRTSLGY